MITIKNGLYIILMSVNKKGTVNLYEKRSRKWTFWWKQAVKDVKKTLMCIRIGWNADPDLGGKKLPGCQTKIPYKFNWEI